MELQADRQEGILSSSTRLSINGGLHGCQQSSSVGWRQQQQQQQQQQQTAERCRQQWAKPAMHCPLSLTTVPS